LKNLAAGKEKIKKSSADCQLLPCSIRRKVDLQKEGKEKPKKFTESR